MSFTTTKYWKRLNDDGQVLAIFRRQFVNGLIQMDVYNYFGKWSPAYDYLLEAEESPDFVEITAREAKRLMPRVRSRRTV